VTKKVVAIFATPKI